MRIAILAVILAVLLAFLALAAIGVADDGWIEGTPEVIDGDTIAFPGHDKNLRLLGIDAPELSQPGGQEAKLLLIAMTSHGAIRCEWSDVGRYDRPLATCYAQTRSGAWSKKSINARMVRRGAAWASVRYGDEYAREMHLAMKDCALLWEHAPWCWRRNQR